MFEETNAASMNMSSASIWSSMASWFTPTVLFLLLNLMIGTIALSSTLSSHKHKHPKKNQEPHGHHLVKSPSVLHRLRSINFSSFRFHETSSIFKPSPDSDAQTSDESQFHHTHQEKSVLESPATHYTFRQEYLQEESHTHYTFRQEEEEVVERESMEEVYSRLNRNPESRSQPEAKTSAEEEEELPAAKMKKSASVKSRVNPFESGGDLERRRPATMKERGTAAADLEVDARADDFINRFRQQLKMQRLDSILRYKEMIGRGAGK